MNSGKLSSRNLLKHFFDPSLIQIFCTFLFIAFSYPAYATSYTVNTSTNNFGGTNILAPGDSLTIENGGNLNNGANASVVFAQGPATTTITVQSGGAIGTTTSPNTIGSGSGLLVPFITVNAGGSILNNAVGGYAMDFDGANASSNITISNSGTIQGVLSLVNSATPNALISYTHNNLAILRYAVPGGNNIPLLNAKDSTKSTATLNGGTIAGQIAGFENVNIGGNFTTSSGGMGDLTGIFSCTNINVNSGTFTVAHALSAITNVTIANGATMLFNSGGTLSHSGTFTLSGSGTLNLNGQSQTVQNLTSTSNTSSIVLGSATLTTNSGSNTTFAGVISGTGDVTKTGASTLTLSGNNTYTGTTTVSNGTLAMGITNALAAASTLNVGGGTTFNLANFSQTIGNLTGSGDVTLGTATLAVGTMNSTTFSGVISGTGGLTKTGAGTLTLSDNNTYTGTTTVNGGILRKGTANALTTTSSLNVGAAGTFDLNNFSQTIGDLSGSGSITLGSATLTTGTATANTTFSGVISGTGGLTKTGAGTLTLSGNNTYTGTTTVSAGTLRMGIANGLAATSALNVGGAGTFSLNGFSQTIGDLSGSGGITLGNATLTTGTATASTTFSGVISGTGGLTKQGTGTLILSGNNTYTGTTSINTGILRIPGGGAITGPVSINTATLEMNGGSIAGVITGTANSTLAVTGNFATAAAITNVGTITVTNPNTFSINHPVTGVNSLTGGTATVNINTAFTTPTTTTMGKINVNAGGILTLGNALTVTSLLSVNAGGTLLLTNNITGSVNNAGTLTHSQEVTRNISGNFVNSGTIGVSISDINHFSQIRVGGTTTLDGGTIQITLPNGKSLEILDQDIFDVIASTGPITVNALPALNFPTSRVLFFQPSVFNNNLRITAIRLPLQIVDPSPIFRDLNNALNDIRIRSVDPELLALVDLVDSQETRPELDAVLQSISPAGINGAIFDITTQNLPFAFIENRLGVERVRSSLQAAVDRFERGSGYAAGDMLEGNGSYGPVVFGHSTQQESRGGITGYNALTGGFGLLADGPLSENVRAGGAITYAGSSIKQKDTTGNTLLIGNVQGTVYGSAYYGPLFLDGLVSVGLNNYQGKRNVTVISQTATSNYHGLQYNAKLKGGFAIPLYGIEASPLATLQYTHLNQGGYTEKGAPGANLTVSPVTVNAVQVGLGGSIAEVSQAEDFLPELHALYLYYTKQPNLNINSQFVEGGPAFVITSILPPRASLNVGGSITAMFTDQFLVTANYDVELRKGFISHSAAFKFKWLF